MRRRLLNLATVLSLLLCMALVAMWVRSFWVIDWTDRWKVEPGGEYSMTTAWSAEVCRGSVLLVEMRQRIRSEFAGPVGTTWICGIDRSFDGIHAHTRQFGFDRTPRGSFVALPLWLPALLLALLPLRGLHRRLRRRRAGHCAVCGYDLRATPDRCPECGTTDAGDGTLPAHTRVIR